MVTKQLPWSIYGDAPIQWWRGAVRGTAGSELVVSWGKETLKLK
jgi:hypothetical protein